MMQRPMEPYLTQVRRSLRMLPTALREEEENELRRHLTALIARFEAEGQALEMAESAALRHFGPPTQVARRLVAAWWRGQFRNAAQSVPGAALLLGSVLFAPNLLNRWLVPGVLSGAGPLLWFWPIGISLIVGYWQPQRALRIVPAAFLVQAICVSIDILGIPLLQSGIRHVMGAGHELVLTEGFWTRNGVPLCFEGVVNALLGLAFAALGVFTRRVLTMRAWRIWS